MKVGIRNPVFKGNPRPFGKENAFHLLKTVLLFFFLVPCYLSAQWRFDTLTNRFTYTCNCTESLIVQGTPTEIKYRSKNKSESLFQIEIDTLFFAAYQNAIQDETVFVLSKNVETSRKIRNSNLFVLRRCLYCDGPNPLNCRPMQYFETLDAVHNGSVPPQIIRRLGHYSIPCVDCQAARNYARRNSKKQNFRSLDDVEKVIEKWHRRKDRCES